MLYKIASYQDYALDDNLLAMMLCGGCVRNIGSLLAMMLCTIVIVSTVGNFFVTRDAFAQQEQPRQTDQVELIMSILSSGASGYAFR